MKNIIVALFTVILLRASSNFPFDRIPIASRAEG